MATSSILGGDRVPGTPSGTDMASLGPSDLSDSGSDLIGAFGPEELEGDSDSVGTGERATMQSDFSVSGADILPDHTEALALADALDEDSEEAVQETTSVEEDLGNQEDKEDLEPFRSDQAPRADGLTASEAVEDRPELIDTPADVRALAVDEEPLDDDDAALDQEP